jgi:hypothetical protein
MAPFLSLATSRSVVRWVDVGVSVVLFFAAGILGVFPTNGPGITVLAGVPPPCVLATFAAKFYASFSLNFPACVSTAFSHARASR